MAKPQKKTKHYLTPAQKAEAVRLWHTGRFTRVELAEKFDISPTTLGKLIKAAPATATPSLDERADGLIKMGESIARIKAQAEAIGYAFEYRLTPKE